MKLLNLQPRHPSGLPLADIWPGQDSTTKRLKFVNEGDFPREAILRGLGLVNSPLRHSYGITDRKALEQRLELVQYLRSNPEVRKLFWTTEETHGLPDDQKTFLETFPGEGRSLFWRKLTACIGAIKASGNPPACLVQLADSLSSMLPFEAIEREATKRIATTIEGMVCINAMLRIPLKVGLNSKNEKVFAIAYPYKEKDEQSWVSNFYGYRAYGGLVSWQSEQEMIASVKERRKLKNTSPELWFEVFWRLATFSFRKRSGLRASVITSPEGTAMTGDVLSFLEPLIAATSAKGFNEHGYNLSVEMRYGEGGMRIRLLGVNVTLATVKAIELWKGFDLSRFSLRSRLRFCKCERKNWSLAQSQTARQLAATVYQRITQTDTRLLDGEFVSAPSPAMDADYKWRSVQGVYKLDEFIATTRKMRWYRDYFEFHRSLLVDVLTDISELERRARSRRLPICVPRLVEGHTVTGRRLVPMQLLPADGSRRRVVPMEGELSLNGRMLAVNGGHGDGKTELLHLFPALLYLAHSGLPVFGENFEFNPKAIIGLCFITQKGEGSTVEILVKKLKAILAQTKRYKPHEVVAVIDELGSATQEADGAQLAEDVLCELHKRGVSVIYSSQIQQVLHMSCDQLNAVPLRMGERHTIHANSIGDGRLERVVKRSGLGKQLSVRN